MDTGSRTTELTRAEPRVPASADAGAAASDLTTVAFIDDFGLLRQTLADGMQRRAPDLDVVVSAASFTQYARQLADRGRPDVVVMGELRDERLDAGAKIREVVAGGSAVVLVADDSVVDHAASRAAGASMTLPRDASLSAVVHAVRSAHRGRPYRARTGPVGTTLSSSEQRAFVLYLAGSSLDDVARTMGVGYETAKTFLRRVRQKYAAAGRPASTREELRVRAIEDGIEGAAVRPVGARRMRAEPPRRVG